MSAGKGLALKLGVFDAARNWKRAVCAAFGHDVDGISWDRNGACCRRCAAPFLFVAQYETRISHTVSCFLCGHTYHPIGVREGHNEYVCVRCGHPLLFFVASDTYRESLSFTKRVRYLCNLFGHKVHQVTTRHNRTESGAISGGSAIAAAQAIYTLLTWGTFVISSRFALRQRSFKPLLAPSLLGIVLALVRPWTVGDLASLWIQRSFNAEPAATLSLVAVPILAIFLGLCEFKQRSQQTLMHAIAAACRGQRRCR
jgi:hypothetical protein